MDPVFFYITKKTRTTKYSFPQVCVAAYDQSSSIKTGGGGTGELERTVAPPKSEGEPCILENATDLEKIDVSLLF